MGLSEISAAVRAANEQVLGPRSALSSGTATAVQVARGAAYQSVANTTALAITQAAQVMTNTGVVCAAALAVVVAKVLENPANAVKYAPAVAVVTATATWATEYFATASAAAVTVATSYPSQ